MDVDTQHEEESTTSKIHEDNISHRDDYLKLLHDHCKKKL